MLKREKRGGAKRTRLGRGTMRVVFIQLGSSGDGKREAVEEWVRRDLSEGG